MSKTSKREVNMRSFEWFGEGYLTYYGEIKFYVGANIGPDEDNDFYMNSRDFRQLAEDALKIAEELEEIEKELKSKQNNTLEEV